MPGRAKEDIKMIAERERGSGTHAFIKVMDGVL